MIAGQGQQNVVDGMDFDPGLELATRLGNKGAAVARCSGDGLETFGIAEERRYTIHYLTDDTGPEGRRGIVLALPCKTARTGPVTPRAQHDGDRKSTRLNSSHVKT